MQTLPPSPPPWCNPRKGRDQILPSGNLGAGGADAGVLPAVREGQGQDDDDERGGGGGCGGGVAAGRR